MKSALSRTADVVPWLTDALEGDDGERRIGALLVAQALGLPALATSVARASGHGDAAELALRVLVRLGLPGARVLLSGSPPPVLTLHREALAVAGEAVLKLAEPGAGARARGAARRGRLRSWPSSPRGPWAAPARRSPSRPWCACSTTTCSPCTPGARWRVLAESWPDEVLAALGPRLDGTLQPHAVRAWAHVAGPTALQVVKRAMHDERGVGARRRRRERVGRAGGGRRAARRRADGRGAPRAPRRRLHRRPAPARRGAAPAQARALLDSETAVLAAAADAAGELLAREVEPRLDELARATDASVAMAALQGPLRRRRALGRGPRARAGPRRPRGGEAGPLRWAPIARSRWRRAGALLSHARWDVRVEAARVLSVSGGPAARPLLEAAAAKEADPLAHEVLGAALLALSAR